MAPQKRLAQPNVQRGNLVVKPDTAFFIFLAVNLVSAIYSPILDCDETFNFWEPTHYINHGFGMQTWEYSPLYSIRSWTYATLHAIPLFFVSTAPFFPSKAAEFYALRCLLAYVCAICETKLFTAVSLALNPKIGSYLLLCMISSAGMFHASVAYLPSSFAMYCVMFAIPAFLDRRAGRKTATGLMWLALGTIVGWPFVGVLCVPFLIEQLVHCVLTREITGSFLSLFDGLGRSLVILLIEIAIDSAFYKKFTCVPFNIVWYNVLSTAGKGPNIYGTDPWHWYFRNLLINFNIWFILALMSLPLVVFQCLYRKKVASRLNFFPTLILISLLYFWIIIFSAQPHKEERFMYPIYPCIALNAAVSVHILLLIIDTGHSVTYLPQIPAPIKVLGVGTIGLVAICIGVSRMALLATSYTAPFSIYSALNYQDPLNESHPRAMFNVCVGKEWYRFPSSYFLPANARLKFIKSEFNGLLPGEFIENKGAIFDIPPGAWTPPIGMNDENKEDPGKYVEGHSCDYLVDSFFPGVQSTKLEPDYVLDNKNWRRVQCEPFLFAERTSQLARLFWMPEALNLPPEYTRKWGQYCLLERRKGPQFSFKNPIG